MAPAVIVFFNRILITNAIDFCYWGGGNLDHIKAENGNRSDHAVDISYTKGQKMKRLVSAVRVTVLAAAFFASPQVAAQAFAISCDPDIPCIEDMNVTASRGLGDFSFLGGAGGAPGWAIGGGGSPIRVPVNPGVATRTQPGCGREASYQNAVDLAIRAGGTLPGAQIMQGVPMTDPNLTQYANDWVKYQINAYALDLQNPGTIYWRITLHYEFSPSTGRFTSPPHFIGSAVQGCANGG